jgi:TolB-like protein/DNA-binding winged helix-turn-helix (wHTH) protein/tetratricopeptide (TPR) repeat protein
LDERRENVQPSNPSCYFFDDVVVDRANFSVRKLDKTRTLTPRAFDVLVYLIEQRGRVVNKQELFEQIWKESFVTDSALAREIKEIRRALGDEAGAPRYIETVHKRGYRFIAELKPGNPGPAEEVNEVAPGGNFVGSETEAREAEQTPVSPSADRVKNYRIGLLLTLIAVLMTGGVIYYFAIGGRPAIDSVAVIPFLNVSGDPDAEFLSDGITNSIANALAQVPRLRVVPLSKSARYKGGEEDPQETGRALGVGAVLTGRVVLNGDRLQIQTELIDVTEVARLWGGQYDRKLSDILVVQGEIAREVSEKLHLRLSGEEKKRLGKSGTDNPEAYQLYLKGQYFWNKRTPEGLKKSIEYYRQAIDLDPGYALAYVGLAGPYGVMGGLSLLPPEEGFGKSRTALAKALELDDSLAEAHYGLAIVKLLYEWDWAGAEREFNRARELDANLALPHGLYSYYLIQGRVQEAVAEAKRVLAQDPLSLPFNRDLSEAMYCARQPDQTIAQCQQMIEMDPSYPLTRLYLGLAYEQKRMYEKAIAELTQSVALSKGNPEQIGALGYIYAVSGRRGEAQKLLAQLQELSKQRYVQATSFALIHTGLGEKDRAFEWLRKAYEDRDVGLAHLYLRAYPLWDSLRSDARFEELLKSMGLSR